MNESVQAVIVAVIALLVGVGWIIHGWVREFWQHHQTIEVTQQLTTLKAKLAERGLSAEQIVKIINAGLPEEQAAAAAEADEDALDRARRQNSTLYPMFANRVDAAGIVEVIHTTGVYDESTADVTKWMAENAYCGADIARVIRAILKKDDTPTNGPTSAAASRRFSEFDAEAAVPAENATV